MESIIPVDLSVYQYIKDSVLSHFIINSSGTLKFNSSLSSGDIQVYDIVHNEYVNPFTYGRGIVYFDDISTEQLVCTTTYSGTYEQTNRLVIYDQNNNIIDYNSYMVDYVDGRIISKNKIYASSVSFYWNYVSLVDDWLNIESEGTPCVVLCIDDVKKEGFQLGSGNKVIRKSYLYIFASSINERDTLKDKLYNSLYLKKCPFYMYSNGSVLDSDGTFMNRKENLNRSYFYFDRTTFDNSSFIEFEDVYASNYTLGVGPVGTSADILYNDMYTYRATVQFNIQYYNFI